MTKQKIDLSKLTTEQCIKIIHDHMDAICKTTPHNPTISKDDEWNDPIYDHYAQIDDIPGGRKHRSNGN